jgi:hypothetical protein
MPYTSPTNLQKVNPLPKQGKATTTIVSNRIASLKWEFLNCKKPIQFLTQ